MNRDHLTSLLQAVAAGEMTVEAALRQLRDFPTSDLAFAQVDHHRALRTGFPEVVFCEGKEEDQLLAICARLAEAHGSFLGTRVSPAQAKALCEAFPHAQHNALGRTVFLHPEQTPGGSLGPVCIVTAGTSDLPVAEEAAVVADAFGLKVERVTDVGVAGIHRVLSASEALERAGVIIVVAGMEGALPSVIGGLVRQPVIAVPTSIGYGASFGGIAALLGMLNSCAAGVTVVNIDNGFGAAVAAARILQRQSHPEGR